MNRDLVISELYLEELLRKEKILDALDAAGVDNWEGYDYALEGLED